MTKAKEPTSMGGLDIWKKVSTPQHEHTKAFSRGGGFKGTSINGTAMAMMATEMFGPNGIGWGLDLEDEKYVEGAKHVDANGNVIVQDIIHVVRCRIWYMVAGEVYQTSPQFGQTTFVGKNKYGAFTDEEAPKKSITDAQGKCLSLLGFGADIFLGKWDDSKYVNEVKSTQNKEKAKAATAKDDGKKKEAVNAILSVTTRLQDLLKADTVEDGIITEVKGEARTVWKDWNAFAPAEAAGLVKLMQSPELEKY